MEYSDSFKSFRIDLLDADSLHAQISMDIVLLFVLYGEAELTMQEETFQLHVNDMILINPNVAFSYTAGPELLLLQIRIPFEMIGERLFCNSANGKDLRYDNLEKILKRLLEEYVTTDSTAMPFGILSIYYALLDQLKSHFADSGQKEWSGSSKAMDRKDRIEAYLRAGYNHDISLRDLADRLDLSMAYLSRYFKKNFGSNFESYLTRLRLLHVAEELIHTDHSLSQVAAQNGFSGSSRMNQAFQAVYHMSPADYRKESCSKNLTENREKALKKRAIDLLYHEKSNHSPEAVLPAREIVIDATKTAPYAKNWNQVINAGHAEMLLQAQMQKQLLRLQKEIGFSWVRILNMFSENMIGTVMPDTETYYFYRVDQVLDFLIENDMHPFLDLCRTHDPAGKPQMHADLSVFNRITKAFLRHAIHRYGMEEVKQWIIELWDRAQDKAESEEELYKYLELFRSEYTCIKEIIPEIQVGGCGSSHLFHKNSFLRMLRQWKDHAPLPDFFSVHIFAYQRGTSDSTELIRSSSDPDYISHALTQIRQIMEEERFMVPRLYVTEWNQTFFNDNYLNDSCYRACYNLRTMFGSIEKADLMIYDTATDLSAQYPVTSDLLFGGKGLLTRDGYFKPSGLVYSFVGHLLPLCIDRTDQYIVTTDGRGLYAIIAHNGKELNNRYYGTEENCLQRENLWQYYEDTKNKDFHIVLDHVESGMYQFHVWQVNEENGSVLDQWRFMDFGDTSNLGTQRFFDQAVNPGFYHFNRKAEEGKLLLEWRLKVNEAILIRIERIQDNG